MKYDVFKIIEERIMDERSRIRELKVDGLWESQLGTEEQVPIP